MSLSEQNEVQVGRRFEHARLIQGSPRAGTARPDVCTVTRIVFRGNPDRETVYYRTETGQSVKADMDYFLNQSLGTWIDPGPEGPRPATASAQSLLDLALAAARDVKADGSEEALQGALHVLRAILSAESEPAEELVR